MSRMTILTDPHEELRMTAEPLSVDEMTSEVFQNLINDMMETMTSADGIGLAGPQVGARKRIFIGVLDGEPHVFINPEIIKTSLRKVNSEEGCLSIPKVWGIVRRHRQIVVKYLDREGKKQKRKMKGLEGIVVQHETDHLDGVLFTDKIVKFTTAPKTL
ncbi:peptide deformylase [Candidatus Uhrbacteria bacterium RIFCSPHIGHO2_02_FULL_54_11]|nr:MAG: peptide deformylase [Candidatus Uhrbacteria bacterium RIFCSPHIGHO2_02_FULL_54_11]